MNVIPEPGRERDRLLFDLLFPDADRGLGSPAYSTSDPDALLVLTAMEARGYYWEVYRDEDGGIGQGAGGGPHTYTAMFSHYGSADLYYGECLPTIAAAITEAALAALEGEQCQS